MKWRYIHCEENTQTEIILRKDTHREKTHTGRRDTRKKDKHGAGTHMKAWNIYLVRGINGSGTTRRRERGYMGGEDILVEEGGGYCWFITYPLIICDVQLASARLSHLCWSGYLYLRASDFRNIELRKSVKHT